MGVAGEIAHLINQLTVQLFVKNQGAIIHIRLQTGDAPFLISGPGGFEHPRWIFKLAETAVITV